MHSVENLILITSMLVLISIYFSKISFKFGIPVLIIFLTIGMATGSDGLNLIYFDNYKIAKSIGIIALTVILFAGGLDTKKERIKPVLKEGLTLASLGVLITAILTGIIVYFLTNFTIWESMLLGSIVSSTDAAAVFSILRTKNFILKNNLGPLLELESGSNDPMAYLLMVIFLGVVFSGGEMNSYDIIMMLLKQVVIGISCGYLFGKMMIFIFNNIKLHITGLYPVLGLTLSLFCFSMTSFLDGNGVLAIYISGVILGNSEFVFKKNVIRFFDGLSWLMQLVVFLTLGLLISPKQLLNIFGAGMGIAFFLMFIARPVAVFLTTFKFKRFKFKEKILLSWVGLRGASSIVFGIYPMITGIEKAHFIFNLVFFIAVSSVLFQGMTLNYIAKKLELAEEETDNLSNHPLAIEDSFKNEILEITVNTRNNDIINQKIKHINFPKNSLIIRIERDGKYISPNGETVILEGDKLLVTVEDINIYSEVKKIFS